MKSGIVLGMTVVLLLLAASCKKTHMPAAEKDASVRIAVLDSGDRPVPDVEVRIYDEAAGAELGKDAFAKPSDIVRTGKDGVARYAVKAVRWFAEKKQRQITFAVLSGDLGSYRVWSAVHPVHTGQRLSVEIRLAGLGDIPGDSELESLRITRMPGKRSYTLGESLDITGLEVAGRYRDGKERTLNVTAEQISGFSSDRPSREQTLTVAVGGKQASFTVKVLPIRVTSGVLTEAVESDYDEIVLPGNVRTIAEKAFAASRISKVTLNDGLQEIGEMAFSGASVQEIVLPRSVERLGEYAFYHCESLARADLSRAGLSVLPRNLFAYAGIEEILWPAHLEEIGIQCFLGTDRLEKAELPETVRRIGFEAFRESGIRSAALPNGVKEIAGRAFYLCNALTDVSVHGAKGDTSDGVIRGTCFVGCPALKHFAIPEGIGTLEQNLLSQNTGVFSVTIPSGVRKIAFGAFDNTGIREVRVEAAVPPVAELVNGQWYGFPKGVQKIRVPDGTGGIYKKAEGWSQYADRIF